MVEHESHGQYLAVSNSTKKHWVGGRSRKQNKNSKTPKELEEEIKKIKPTLWHNLGNNENPKGSQTAINDNLKDKW